MLSIPGGTVMLLASRTRACLAALVLTTGAARAQQRSFTIEQALSAPFPDELVAAPAGGALAWVFNAQGVRNIWIATGPEYQGRAVTGYQEDDGQEIGELAWTPDARTLVYVRGGPANGRGEYPNPLSLPAGVEQALWIVAATGGAPRRLSEGHAPAVSPKGDRVAFLNKGQIWWAPLADSAKPEQLVHARGGAQSLRWSPDGSKLAFVSSRGDHGFVGVYDVATKALKFLDASVDDDGEPVWSPDGAQLAFIRVPAGEPALPFTPRRAAPPWSIRVVNLATGRGREVWKADTGRGSAFRGIVAEDQLLWGAGSRLVFPWEKDGWTHLYAVPSSGGAATLLTPGTFEVEHVALAPDGREVVFSSNQDDSDRRHGGSRREMLLGWHYLYYYRNAYALNQYLASRGFVVLSVNYRSGIGYGIEFREALHYGAQGASEFGDVLGAGLYLRGRGDVDPKRIGLWGGSYGGFLTAMGLARASQLFAAGVDLHGVHDWNVEIRNWVPDYDPQKRADFAKLAFESSPIAYVKDWRSPVLLIQGDDDRNVQFSQTVDLAAALRPLGVEVEQLVFPDEVHDFLTHAHWLAAYHAAAEFLERRLAAGPVAGAR